MKAVDSSVHCVIIANRAGRFRTSTTPRSSPASVAEAYGKKPQHAAVTAGKNKLEEKIANLHSCNIFTRSSLATCP